jgi:outer membrane protein assembly factor BamD
MRWILLLLWMMITSPLRTAHADVEAPSVAEQYDLGLKFLRRGYYVKAMEQFNRIRNYHRDDPYAVLAELAIADLYYEKGEWDQARLAYMDFQRSHPRHEELDYVVYRIGMSLYRKAPKISARDQIWTRQTVNQWTGYGTRFPDSEYREEVEEMLFECQERLAKKELVIARFYEGRDAWKAVQGRTEGLLHGWPSSEYIPEALELLAQAQAWQGESEAARATQAKLVEIDPSLGADLGARIDKIESALLDAD